MRTKIILQKLSIQDGSNMWVWTDIETDDPSSTVQWHITESRTTRSYSDMYQSVIL